MKNKNFLFHASDCKTATSDVLVSTLKEIIARCWQNCKWYCQSGILVLNIKVSLESACINNTE